MTRRKIIGRALLLAISTLIAIWLVLRFANQIDGTDQQQAAHALQQLREELNDCHTALDVRCRETLFLLPPVSNEAVITAWKNHKEN